MKRQITNRLVIRFGAVCLIVGLLALASSMFHEDWHGGFPVGEFRIAVVDEQGQPIPGALVREHFDDTPSHTDDRGRIVITQHRGGIQYGGSRWHLFWIIPMGDQPPDYIWEVTADGFRPHRVSWPELHSAPQSTQQPTAVHVIGDKKVELRVIDVLVTLKR